MAPTRCPECRKNQRIRSILSKLWVLFKKEDLEIYKQNSNNDANKMPEINRKSTKLHLIWLAILLSLSYWQVD